MHKTELSEIEHPVDLACRSIRGGRPHLAQLLNVTPAAIGNWKMRPAVPVEHCFAIELATNGAVTRKDLRPNDWQKIWPDLAEKAAA